MRVVHLAAVDAQGGAARAAFRLHEGLLAAGVHSTLLVSRKTTSAESVCVAPLTPDQTFTSHLVEKYYLEPQRTGVSNTYLSAGWPGIELQDHPVVQAADVVHLHWVAGIQSAATIARLAQLGKPIVWTLHDQRPFTGGCHFSAGCSGYEQTCAGCPQLEPNAQTFASENLAEQLRCLPVGAMTIVAPSHWLADCARRSALFCRARIEWIPYGIPSESFKPASRIASRQNLGLPTDGVQLLFGADYGAEKRKGFAQLLAALEECLNQREFAERVKNGQIRLLAFGRPNPELARLQSPVHYFGYIDNDTALAGIYAAADLFVLPSLEDNLPNTVLESMSCGTPVLAFNIGGLPDLVDDGATGRLVAGGNIFALASAIMGLTGNPTAWQHWGPSARQRIEQQFSLGTQAQRYLTFYRELTSTPARSHHESAPIATPAELKPMRAEQGRHVPEVPASTSPGRGRQTRILLEAVKYYVRTIKQATASDRRLCRELIRGLELETANPELGEEIQHCRARAQLLSKLQAADAQRQERRAAHGERKAARRTRVSRWLHPFRAGRDKPAAG